MPRFTALLLMLNFCFATSEEKLEERKISYLDSIYGKEIAMLRITQFVVVPNSLNRKAKESWKRISVQWLDMVHSLLQKTLVEQSEYKERTMDMIAKLLRAGHTSQAKLKDLLGMHIHFVTVKPLQNLSTHVPGFRQEADSLEQITIGMKFVNASPFSVKFFVVDTNTETNYMPMLRINFMPDPNETGQLLNIIEYNSDFEFCQGGYTLQNIIDNESILDDCSVLIYHLNDLKQNIAVSIDFVKKVGNPNHVFYPQILRILHAIEDVNDLDNVRLKILLHAVLSGQFLECALKRALAENFDKFHRPLGLIRKAWTEVITGQVRLAI